MTEYEIHSFQVDVLLSLEIPTNSSAGLIGYILGIDEFIDFLFSREQGFCLPATLILPRKLFQNNIITSTKSAALTPHIYTPPVIIQRHTQMMLITRQSRWTRKLNQNINLSNHSVLFKSVALERRHVLHIKILGPPNIPGSQHGQHSALCKPVAP